MLGINLNTMSEMFSLKKEEHLTIVRSFEEMPDTIFLGYSNGNQFHMGVMFPKDYVKCDEVHGGPITDIHIMTMGG